MKFSIELRMGNSQFRQSIALLLPIVKLVLTSNGTPSPVMELG